MSVGSFKTNSLTTLYALWDGRYRVATVFISWKNHGISGIEIIWNLWKSHVILTKIGKGHGILEFGETVMEFYKHILNRRELVLLHGSFSKANPFVCQLKGCGTVILSLKIMVKSCNFVERISWQPCKASTQ